MPRTPTITVANRTNALFVVEADAIADSGVVNGAAVTTWPADVAPGGAASLPQFGTTTNATLVTAGQNGHAAVRLTGAQRWAWSGAVTAPTGKLHFFFVIDHSAAPTGYSALSDIQSPRLTTFTSFVLDPGAGAGIYYGPTPADIYGANNLNCSLYEFIIDPVNAVSRLLINGVQVGVDKAFPATYAGSGGDVIKTLFGTYDNAAEGLIGDAYLAAGYYNPTAAQITSIRNDIGVAYALGFGTAPADTTKPTITSATVPAAGTPVTIQASEPLSGVTLSDFTIPGRTLSNFVVVDADTFTADVTPALYQGVAYTLDILAGAFTDTAAAPNSNDAQTVAITNNSTVTAPSFTFTAQDLTGQRVLFSMRQAGAFTNAWTDDVLGLGAPIGAEPSYGTNPWYSDPSVVFPGFIADTTIAHPLGYQAIKLFGGIANPEANYSIPLPGLAPRQGWAAEVDFYLNAAGATAAAGDNSGQTVLHVKRQGANDPTYFNATNGKFYVHQPGVSTEIMNLPTGMASWSADTWYRLRVVYPDIVAFPTRGIRVYLNGTLLGETTGIPNPNQFDYDRFQGAGGLYIAGSPNLRWSNLHLVAGAFAPADAIPTTALPALITADYAQVSPPALEAGLPSVVFPYLQHAGVKASARGARIANMTSQTLIRTTAATGFELYKGYYLNIDGVLSQIADMPLGTKLHLSFGYRENATDGTQVDNTGDPLNLPLWVIVAEFNVFKLNQLRPGDVESATPWNEPGLFGVSSATKYAEIWNAWMPAVKAVLPALKCLFGEFYWLESPLIRAAADLVKTGANIPDGYGFHPYYVDLSASLADVAAFDTYYKSATGFNKPSSGFYAITEDNLSILHLERGLEQTPAFIERSWYGAMVAQKLDVYDRFTPAVSRYYHFVGRDKNGNSADTNSHLRESGLTTIDHKPKPAGNAYRMFGQLESLRLTATNQGPSGSGAIITRDPAGTRLGMLVYNAGVVLPVPRTYPQTVRVANAPAGMSKALVWRMDKTHASVREQGGTATGELVDEPAFATLTYEGTTAVLIFDAAPATTVFLDFATVDTDLPQLVTVTIDVGGQTVTLTFDEPTTGSAGLKLRVGGVERTVTFPARTTASTTLVGTITGTVYQGQAVTLDYDTLTGDILDTATMPNELAAFTGRTVTNGSTVQISGAAVAPVFTPGGGFYSGSRNVSITSATAGASIYYTVNGATPSATTGTLYTAPVNIPVGSHVLKAVALASGMTDSPVTSAEYSITAGAGAGTFSYAGIYDWIRSRLQDSVAGLDNAVFDRDIRSEINRLFAPYGGQTFAALTGSDKENTDEAIGLYVAVRLNVPLSTGGLVAPLVYENVTTAGNTRITRQTAQISNTANGLDERTKWSREALAAWRRVSFVQTPSIVRSGVATRTRAGQSGRGGW